MFDEDYSSVTPDPKRFVASESVYNDKSINGCTANGCYDIKNAKQSVLEYFPLKFQSHVHQMCVVDSVDLPGSAIEAEVDTGE